MHGEHGGSITVPVPRQILRESKHDGGRVEILGHRAFDLVTVEEPLYSAGIELTQGGMGTNTYPAAGDPSISDLFGLLPGDIRYFMVWYRDPLGACGAGFNTTNGLRVRWGA